MDSLFGPLSRDYCVYFHILAVINVLFLVISVGLFAYSFVAGHKISSYKVVHYIASFVTFFMAYFVNRLLYTICSKSL